MKRIDYVDVAKGIATVCVILGHLSVTPKILVNEIYTFHIPLFFFLSGFVINLDKYLSFKDYFVDKVKKIVIPYLLLSLITWIWIYWVRGFPNFITPSSIDKLFGILICAKDTPFYLTLWFIASLFFSQLLLYILIKFKPGKYIPLRFILCFCIAIVISKIYHPGWIWALDTVPMATVFLGGGYFLKQNLSNVEKFFHPRFLFVALPLNVLIGYFNFIQHGGPDLFYQNIGNPLLYILMSIFGIWMTLIISKMMHNFSVLKYIGKNSLIFYAFHRPIFVPMAMFILPYLKSYSSIFRNSIVQTITVFSIIFIGLVIISEIINKFFPFVVGKKYNKV